MKKPARRRLSRVFCMFRVGAELYVVREAGLPQSFPKTDQAKLCVENA